MLWTLLLPSRLGSKLGWFSKISISTINIKTPQQLWSNLSNLQVNVSTCEPCSVQHVSIYGTLDRQSCHSYGRKFWMWCINCGSPCSCRSTEPGCDLAAKLVDKPGKLHILKTDITVEDDILKAFEWTKENLGPIHILINSAGISKICRLIDGETEKWKQVFNTNVIGLCICTREAVKDMRANGTKGHVIHINSVLGHYVYNIPNVSMYPASKYAVTALAETLRQELISVESDIKVTSVSPGAIDTDFPISNELLINQESIDFYKTIPKLKPSDITAAVIYSLSTPPETLVSEITLRPMGALV